MTHAQIMDLIAVLKHSHKSVEKIFTEGACYELYRMLKIIEPSAEPWFDGNHVYTKINGVFYDIVGAHTFSPMGLRGMRLMTEDDHAGGAVLGDESI